MKWILDISTVLGGIAAIIFFYDRFKNVLQIRERIITESNRTVASKAESGSTRTRQSIYPRYVEIGILLHCIFGSLCFGLAGIYSGVTAHFLVALFVFAVSTLISYILEKTGHEEASSIFLFGGCFTIFGGIIVGMVGDGIFLFLGGDDNFYAGSGSSIFALFFGLAAAIASSRLIIRG